MVTEEEYNKALITIKEYQNQFVKLTSEDELFIGMKFISKINGNVTNCTITNIEIKEYYFGKVELVTFTGFYTTNKNNFIYEYKQTWSLSKNQIIENNTVWAKSLELAKKRDNIINNILN